MNNIIFLGTNNFAASILKNLIKKNIKIKNIITKCDKKIGRGQNIKSYPVKNIAIKNKINIYTIKTINNTETNNLIKKINPQLIIMTEYGEKINKDVIKIPKYGIINVHPSILPKFRGATPIQQAIINGESETGVSIIEINENIDSGYILNIEKCKINDNDTYLSLSKKLIKLSIKCLIKTFNEIKKNTIIKKIQNNIKSVYAFKLKKIFYTINWDDTAININRKIRSVYGIKKLNSKIHNYEIKIIETKVIKKYKNKVAEPGTIINVNKFGIDVMTSNQIIRIKKLQFPGKKINLTKDILNSKKNLFKIGFKFE